MTGIAATVQVRVELFGIPQIRSGRRVVELVVPYPASRPLLLAVLSAECPALVGQGIREDLADLQEGYVFNLNGLEFLGEADFALADGDFLLLMSGQAGG